jgi:hypothetical protein
MRVCVLTDEVIEDFDPTPYMQGFEWKMFTMKDPVLDVLRDLDSRNNYDVYLNLCEGFEPGEEWEYQGCARTGRIKSAFYWCRLKIL